jgi:hypothetical protein
MAAGIPDERVTRPTRWARIVSAISLLILDSTLGLLHD